MRKKFLACLIVIATTVVGLSILSPLQARAEEKKTAFFTPGDGCTRTFLGFRPWYQGLPRGEAVNGSSLCVVGTPTEDQLPAFVWTIVLNVLADLFSVIGYLAIIFVIYGGFLFIMARGDPGKIAKGKKTLTTAVIGVAIAILATLIVNTIIGVLSGAFK